MKFSKAYPLHRVHRGEEEEEEENRQVCIL